MVGLGTLGLMIILAIAFLIFGGKKLSELGQGLEKGISSFKKGLMKTISLMVTNRAQCSTLL